MAGKITPGSGSGGGGIKLRTPPDIFTGATKSAAETARNSGLDAGALAEFNADPNLAIILRVSGSDTYQVRRSGAWRDVTNVVRGPAGAAGADGADGADGSVASVKDFARTGGPVVPDSEIDAAIARDSEVTTIVRTIFTVAQETKLAGIATGAEVNLTGAALQSAIDSATGGTVWRSAHTVLRTAIEVRDLLDGLLGTGWRTSSGGSGGITLDQAIDGVGAALSALAEFSYDSSANTFTFSVTANSISAAQARANSDAHKLEWRQRIGASTVVGNPSGARDTELEAIEVDGTSFYLPTVEANPDSDATVTLSKLQLGATVYSIPTGSSGGTGLTAEQTAKLAARSRNPQADGAALTESYVLVGTYAMRDYDSGVFTGNSLDKGQVMIGPVATPRLVKIRLQDVDLEAVAMFERSATANSTIKIRRTGTGGATVVQGTITVQHDRTNQVRELTVSSPQVAAVANGSAVEVDIQSEIDAFLSSHETRIDAHDTSIADKASQSSVTQLTARVASLEAVPATSDGISDIVEIPEAATSMSFGIAGRNGTPSTVRTNAAGAMSGSVFWYDYRDVAGKTFIVGAKTADFNVFLANLIDIGAVGVRDSFDEAHRFRIQNADNDQRVTFGGGGVATIRPTAAEGGAIVEHGFSALISLRAFRTNEYELFVNSFIPTPATAHDDLAEHEANPWAHQDNPPRVDHLGVNAPVDREVYLTASVHHPGPEHIFSVVLGRLMPNNAAGNPAFAGVSVVDFSSDSGPVATADTSAFPAVLNAARIAAIFEDEGDETFFTVAVNKAIDTDAPTHLSVDYGLLAPPEHTSHRIALTQHSEVTVGGQTYRMMRTPGALLVIYLNNMLNSSPPQDPTFYFSLEYPDGFLKADGTLDTGTTVPAGDYKSLGSGKWMPKITVLGAGSEASAATLKNLKYEAGTLYRNRPVHHTAQQVTWRDFATSDLPAGYRWRGAFETAPLLSGIQVNDVFFVRPLNRFYRHATVARAVQWDLPDYLGQFGSEDLADAPVTKVGQRAYWGGKLQVVATYSTKLPDTYEWWPVVPTRFETTVGTSPAVLPEGTHELSVLARVSGSGANRYIDHRVLLSNIPAANRKFFFRGEGGDEIAAVLRYAPGTRTLTYSTADTSGTVELTSIKAIGAI